MSSIKLELQMNPFTDSGILASIEGVDNLTITPDLANAANDTKEQRALKVAERVKILRNQREFYEGILSLKEDQRFKNLESLLLRIVKAIDQKEIWNAIKNGDQNAFNCLVAQRVGIVSLANVFESVRGKAIQAVRDLEELTVRDDDDQSPSGPNYNDLQD